METSRSNRNTSVALVVLLACVLAVSGWMLWQHHQDQVEQQRQVDRFTQQLLNHMNGTTP